MQTITLAVVGAFFTDSRDGQTYRMVAMPDGKTWMAENLNYVNDGWSHNDVSGSVLSSALGSWCYDNNASNCIAYGRLYTWNAARVACPAGWSLPTVQEWTVLVNATGGNVAGTALKAQSPAWTGTDDFSFSALPGGHRWNTGSFYNIDSHGYWWTATESSSDHAYYRHTYSGYSHMIEFWSTKNYGFSMRCVMD